MCWQKWLSVSHSGYLLRNLFGLSQVLTPIIRRGETVNFLEISREVALILDSYSEHDLLDGQKCVLQQLPGYLHPLDFEILRRREAGPVLK